MIRVSILQFKNNFGYRAKIMANSLIFDENTSASHDLLV